MPSEIKNRRVLASVQRGFRKELGQAYRDMGNQIRGAILIHADSDGNIPLDRLNRVQTQAGNILSGFFVGLDGRSPFADDGTTPLATYPRILNKWIGLSVGRMVLAHNSWMKQNVPNDVMDWLSTVESRDVPIAEISLSVGQIDALKLFHPNPLAEYEPAHTWVDPNGYRLSDRIWRTSVRTRMQLDALIAEGIREGKSATWLANRAEQFLHPNRAKIRTKKPYGRDGSFDAMRLARTEIARAGNQAAFISSYTNPYVDKIDVARSANGDPTCPICPQHATIGLGGERLREPYSVRDAPSPPWHPHCMCVSMGVVADSSTVTENLRTIIEESESDLIPYVTPAQPRNLVRQLLGDIIFAVIVSELFQNS